MSCNPAAGFLAALNRAYWLGMAATVSYFGGTEAMLGPTVSRQDSPQAEAQVHEGCQDNAIQNSSSPTDHALSSTSTSMAADVSGFLLLTLPDCRIECAGNVYQGTLALECITLAAASPEAERDVWLVLRLDNFETPVPPTQPIIHERAQGVYTIPGTPSAARLRLPLAAPNTPLREDLDTLEVLLAQYGVVHEAEGGAPAGTVADEKKDANQLKGRLVLVDESDGEVVGTLGEAFTVHEDENVTRRGREKDPVVVDLPEYGAPQELYVHAVRPEESDGLLRSAHFLSRGIVLATTAIAAGMAMASSKFVASTAPNPAPVVFSEQTRRNVKRVHNISGKAVTVTARTTGLIHRAVDQAASYIAGRSNSRAPSPAPSPTSQYPPPLPPRKGLGSRAASSGHLSAPPPLPPRKPRLLNSLLMSTDLILTTLEQSGKHLLTHGTHALSSGMGHRYGTDVGEAVRMGGETMRNVGVVYIDARGVGRRALLKRAGKGVVTARLGNKDVVFGADVPPPVPPR